MLDTWSVYNDWCLRRHQVIIPCLFSLCRSNYIHWVYMTGLVSTWLWLPYSGSTGSGSSMHSSTWTWAWGYMTYQEQFLLVSAFVSNLEVSGPQLQVMMLVPCFCLVNGLDGYNRMEWRASLRAFPSEENWDHIYRDILCFGWVTDDGWLKETDNFHPQVLNSSHLLPPSRLALASLVWKLARYITVSPGTTVFHPQTIVWLYILQACILLNDSMSVPSRTTVCNPRISVSPLGWLVSGSLTTINLQERQTVISGITVLYPLEILTVKLDE